MGCSYVVAVGLCSWRAQDRGGPGVEGTHTHTHKNTQELTRECRTYPLATQPRDLPLSGNTGRDPEIHG